MYRGLCALKNDCVRILRRFSNGTIDLYIILYNKNIMRNVDKESAIMCCKYVLIASIV